MGVPKLSEIDAPGKPEEMYRETKMVQICYNHREVQQRWAEREYRLNGLAANSFEQKLTHNPKVYRAVV